MIGKIIFISGQKFVLVDEKAEIKPGDKVLVNGITYKNEIHIFQNYPCPPPDVTNKSICKLIIADESTCIQTYSEIIEIIEEIKGFMEGAKLYPDSDEPDLHYLKLLQRSAFVEGRKSILSDKEFNQNDMENLFYFSVNINNEDSNVDDADFRHALNSIRKTYPCVICEYEEKDGKINVTKINLTIS